MVLASATADVLLILAVVVATVVLLRRRQARPPAADPIATARADAERIREAVDFVSMWELERLPLYAEAAERLRAAAPPTADLLPLTEGPDEVLACLALRVLRERDDLPPDWVDTVLARLTRSGYADELELLATIAERPGRLIGPVLARARHVSPNALTWFLERRAANGEPLDDATFGELPDGVGAQVDEYLENADSVPAGVRDAFRTWWRPRAAREHLRGFAKLWPAPFDEPPAALVGDRPDVVEALTAALAGEERRSVVLVGEHGVGKTRLIGAALARAGGRPLVFEASAAMVNAGAMYVGQLEGRVQELVSRLVGLEAVWVLPNLEQVLWAGQTTTTPAGLLDALLPHISAGDLIIADETSPAGWEVLVKARPAVASAFVPIRVRPLPETDAIAVAADALRRQGSGITAPAGVIREAYELTQQFLPAGGQPSALVRVVRAAAEVAREEGDEEVASGHLLAVLAEVTGLPLAMLDAATPLDVAGVREHLATRVIGQPEAVDALVERIAMIKAGLTDPSRPLGVFLFVGPTGTGKTELAKALAELVFGSATRLVRLDMSEFQTPASLERLLSDASQDSHAAPLLAAVRKDPFAVVLLDEFEKAAAPVWDLFLQVFDDGRLTDLQGRTVDFRRCVFILTSNMGAAIARGARLGFDRAAQAFNPQAVRRSIESAFRPEFLNRIDRVVVFRPFERADMRALLEIELRQVVQRRGLRARPWAIEYDETALRFLIDRGFSPELGARPLKRAVERYLLAPLAEAIVEQYFMFGVH
jgi:ATP-dependent Clp protease ATP-binding subunit ClpC